MEWTAVDNGMKKDVSDIDVKDVTNPIGVDNNTCNTNIVRVNNNQGQDCQDLNTEGYVDSMGAPNKIPKIGELDCTCHDCGKACHDKENGIRCGTCNRYFHYDCVEFHYDCVDI